jgi:hypothetical protein
VLAVSLIADYYASPSGCISGLPPRYNIAPSQEEATALYLQSELRQGTTSEILPFNPGYHVVRMKNTSTRDIGQYEKFILGCYGSSAHIPGSGIRRCLNVRSILMFTRWSFFQHLVVLRFN